MFHVQSNSISIFFLVWINYTTEYKVSVFIAKKQKDRSKTASSHVRRRILGTNKPLIINKAMLGIKQWELIIKTKRKLSTETNRGIHQETTQPRLEDAAKQKPEVNIGVSIANLRLKYPWEWLLSQY